MLETTVPIQLEAPKIGNLVLSMFTMVYGKDIVRWNYKLIFFGTAFGTWFDRNCD